MQWGVNGDQKQILELEDIKVTGKPKKKKITSSYYILIYLGTIVVLSFKCSMCIPTRDLR